MSVLGQHHPAAAETENLSASQQANNPVQYKIVLTVTAIHSFNILLWMLSMSREDGISKYCIISVLSCLEVNETRAFIWLCRREERLNLKR